METLISIQSKNDIQKYVAQSSKSLQQEALACKCDEISRQVMPVLVKIVTICSKPSSTIGSICCTVVPTPYINIYELPQYRYDNLIIGILQNYCCIKLTHQATLTFGWGQGSTPVGFIIASDLGAIKRPPPFLLNENLESYIE